MHRPWLLPANESSTNVREGLTASAAFAMQYACHGVVATRCINPYIHLPDHNTNTNREVSLPRTRTAGTGKGIGISAAQLQALGLGGTGVGRERAMAREDSLHTRTTPTASTEHLTKHMCGASSLQPLCRAASSAQRFQAMYGGMGPFPSCSVVVFRSLQEVASQRCHK